MYENSLLDEIVLGTVDGCLNGPAMRSIYLRKASEEYNAGNIEKSVYYQMESLCVMGRHKYFIDYMPIELIQQHDPPEFRNRSDFQTNELFEFARKQLKSEKDEKFQKNLTPPNSEEEANEKYEELLEFCKELPKEWTVLHISKEFNPDTTFSTQTEILRQNDAIFLTVLKYSYDEKNSNMIPICIRIPNNNDIFSKYVKILENLREKLHFAGAGNKLNRLKYFGNLKMVEKDIENLIESFKEFIGPWICLFSGDISGGSGGDDKRFARSLKLHEIIDDFFLNNKLSTETRNIINLFVKRLDLLTDTNLEILCEYLSDNEKSENRNQIDLYEKFTEFFYLIKKKYNSDKNSNVKCEYLPCILIIDEAIDHFFWEMLNPKQEFYRMTSIHIFKELYDKYKYRIRNGYIQMSVENGSCIINPDKTLNRMEERMKNFFDYWLQNWQKLIGQIPTSKEFINFLQSSNCFVYCGHGSGLQYISAKHIIKLEINSIIFLFGCESVCLKSDGIHSEMSAAHIFYHAGLSPSIIGSLLPVLDLQMDKLSTCILSTWIPAVKSSSSYNKKVHWLSIDKKIWSKDGKVLKTNSNETNSLPEFEPKLGKILTYIRCDDNISNLYNRVGIIIRGLPVFNQNSTIKRRKSFN